MIFFIEIGIVLAFIAGLILIFSDLILTGIGIAVFLFGLFFAVICILNIIVFIIGLLDDDHDMEMIIGSFFTVIISGLIAWGILGFVFKTSLTGDTYTKEIECSYDAQSLDGSVMLKSASEIPVVSKTESVSFDQNLFHTKNRVSFDHGVGKITFYCGGLYRYLVVEYGSNIHKLKIESADGTQITFLDDSGKTCSCGCAKMYYIYDLGNSQQVTLSFSLKEIFSKKINAIFCTNQFDPFIQSGIYHEIDDCSKMNFEKDMALVGYMGADLSVSEQKVLMGYIQLMSDNKKKENFTIDSAEILNINEIISPEGQVREQKYVVYNVHYTDKNEVVNDTYFINFWDGYSENTPESLYQYYDWGISNYEKAITDAEDEYLVEYYSNNIDGNIVPYDFAKVVANYEIINQTYNIN